MDSLIQISKKKPQKGKEKNLT